MNRVLWRCHDWIWNVLFRRPLNEHRVALGLAPVTDVSSHVATDQPWVAADAVLGPAAPTKKGGVTQTGAWLLPDTTPLPGLLEQFLDRGGDPPLYFGFGSTTVEPGTARVMVAAARSLGRRAVLLRGWTGLAYPDNRAATERRPSGQRGNPQRGPARESPAGASEGIPSGDDQSDCILIDAVNYERLFPRIAVIVHHGGAGTTNAAARAGRPQLIIPHIDDQFYWAHRVRRLGVGTSLRSPAHLSVKNVVAALRICLAPEVTARAASLSGRIELQGAHLAAERLIQRLTGTPA